MDYFNNTCRCGTEMFYYFCYNDDEIFWCENCGRMVIVYKGEKPSEDEWHTPEICRGRNNG